MIKKKMKCKNVILFEAILLCFGLAGLQAQTLQDIDGNVYKTVTIGKQIWMAENLKRATNASGFTALPSGRHTNLGSFGDDGYYGNWWSATEVDSTNAWYYFLNFPSSIIYRGVYFKTDGLSVRCLKDL
jgi:hypothetical protein